MRFFDFFSLTGIRGGVFLGQYRGPKMKTKVVIKNPSGETVGITIFKRKNAAAAAKAYVASVSKAGYTPEIHKA